MAALLVAHARPGVRLAIFALLAACSSPPAPTASPVCGPLSEVCPPDGGIANMRAGCDMDWATAQEPSTWCTWGKSGNQTYETGADSFEIATYCDVNIVTVSYGSAVASYYFDPQTGVLVAMSGGSGGRRR
ncbi:MAG: hypothetical protein ACLP1X_35335 [Polyangiaceae bacterium]